MKINDKPEIWVSTKNNCLWHDEKLLIKVDGRSNFNLFLLIEPVDYDSVRTEEGILKQFKSYYRNGKFRGRFFYYDDEKEVRKATEEEIKRGKAIWENLKLKLIARCI